MVARDEGGGAGWDSRGGGKRQWEAAVGVGEARCGSGRLAVRRKGVSGVIGGERLLVGRLVALTRRGWLVT